MSDDDFSSFNAPQPRRKRFPRWLILVFIMDTILVAAVLYWILGRTGASENQSDAEMPVRNVLAPSNIEPLNLAWFDTELAANRA